MERIDIDLKEIMDRDSLSINANTPKRFFNLYATLVECNRSDNKKGYFRANIYHISGITAVLREHYAYPEFPIKEFRPWCTESNVSLYGGEDSVEELVSKLTKFLS